MLLFDIFDDESFFEFSTKAEFSSPLYVHINLATGRITSHNCDSDKKYVETLSIQMFKWLLNQLLLKTECLEVMLIW